MTRPVKPKRPPAGAADTRAFGSFPSGQEELRQKPEASNGGKPGVKKSACKAGVADQIGVHLRSIYDDILAQPVPARFLDLLQKLESTSSGRPGKDGM